MKLSILIPVYNEEKTIGKVLERVASLKIPKVAWEIIVIDDGSTDKTSSKLKAQSSKLENIRVITHSKNLGKGSAVKTGIKNSSGDYIVIQDADLEYNPQDIPRLVNFILNNKAEVVYGTRLKRWPNLARDERSLRFLLHYFGNRFLSLVTSILYGQWLTDMETCYKVFPKKTVESMNLRSKRFEFEPEITAKLLKKGYKIFEVAISTNPRGYNEGKKLNTFRDGLIALWSLIKYRFVD